MRRNFRDTRSLIKISRPRLADTLARERLFKKLDAARAQSVTWIMGPAGSGKTTLIGSYVDVRKLPCMWYQVDEGDEDVATFFYYLGLAAGQINPRKKKALPLFSVEYVRGVPTFARNFFVDLCDRLPRPGLLVLDNYHAVGSDSNLHEVMRAGLDTVPPDCHVVVIGRHAPPPALARLQANGAMTVIGWQDLQLTEPEARQIVALRQPDSNGLPGFKQWMARTQGWVAGLVLLLEWLRTEEVDPEALASFGPESIFDYFAGELLERMEPHIRMFLLTSAILPKMTARMTAVLTGERHAEGILAELHRRNLFVTRHTNAHKIYQYHPLLREFLLAQLEEQLPLDELTGLKRQAAVLLESEGWIEVAIELLREAQDWPRMAEIIKREAQGTLAQGRGQTLAEWIGALPTEFRGHDPWIAYWQGNCPLGQSPQRSLECFEQAFSQFRKMQDLTGVYSAWCGAVESIHVDWGGSQRRWDAWIERLEALLEARLEFPSPEMECRVTLGMNVALEYRMPAHPRRAYWRKHLLDLAAKSEDPTSKVTALAQTVLSDAHCDLARASTIVETLLSQLNAGEISSTANSLAYTALFTYHCATGHIQPMREAAEAGIALTERTGVCAWDYMCHYGAGMAAFLGGDLDKGCDKLRYLAARPEARGCAGAFYHRQLATWESVLRNDYGQALIHARARLRHAKECGFPVFEIWTKADLAWILEHHGERDAARELIDQALHTAREIGTRWLEWATLSMRAYFSFVDGDEMAGLGYLSAERQLARSHGYARGTGTWMGSASPVSRCMLTKSLEFEIEPEVTRRQIRALGVLPDDATHLESWPWAVKIYALGRFEVLRDGRPLRFSRKAPRMPLRLLKALAALGGQGVGEVQLIEALWPHEEGDAAHRAFATTLHRLRCLIGDDVLALNEGRLTIDARRAWIDARAFEELLAQAQTGEQKGRQETATRLLEQAVALYRGPFLTGEPAAPWSGGPRNRLRARFIGATRELAQRYEQARDWMRALACYERGLEVDDLAEEFYRGAMRAHAQLGNRAQGVDTYHRCKRHLSISLSIKPSPATEAVYHSIRDDGAPQAPQSPRSRPSISQSVTNL